MDVCGFGAISGITVSEITTKAEKVSDGASPKYGYPEIVLGEEETVWKTETHSLTVVGLPRTGTRHYRARVGTLPRGECFFESVCFRLLVR